MLLSLAQWLQTLSPEFGFFRVFQYLTFRAVMAALTALLIGLIAGPFVIRRLTELKIGQPVRGYGMQTHLAKSGTPTMGGVLILLSIATSTLLWFDLSNRFVWIVLLVTLGFGAIGWVDDWRKVVHKDPEGMRSREKYFWQSVIGLVAALYLALGLVHHATLNLALVVCIAVLSGYSVLQYSDVRSSYPPDLTGRALSVFTMAMFLGVGLVQSLTGWVADWAQGLGLEPYRAVMATIAALLALGSIAFRWLPASPLLQHPGVQGKDLA